MRQQVSRALALWMGLMAGILLIVIGWNGNAGKLLAAFIAPGYLEVTPSGSGTSNQTTGASVAHVAKSSGGQTVTI